MRDEVDRTSLIIRSHWRNRRETASEGGARLCKVLAALAGVHPAYSHWFKRSSRKPSRDSFCTMPPVMSELASVIERGMQYKDVPREPWPEMGFAAGAWNGAACDAASASFRATIGAYDTAQLGGFNQFDLEVKDFGAEGSLVSARVVAATVAAVIDAMDPDCVDVATARWLLGTREATCPAGGWMSYVRDPLASAVDIPAGVRSARLGEGLLIVVTDDDFSEADPGHVARANALNAALAKVRAWQAAPPEDRAAHGRTSVL